MKTSQIRQTPTFASYTPLHHSVTNTADLSVMSFQRLLQDLSPMNFIPLLPTNRHVGPGLYIFPRPRPWSIAWFHILCNVHTCSGKYTVVDFMGCPPLRCTHAGKTRCQGSVSSWAHHQRGHNLQYTACVPQHKDLSHPEISYVTEVTVQTSNSSYRGKSSFGNLKPQSERILDYTLA